MTLRNLGTNAAGLNNAFASKGQPARSPSLWTPLKTKPTIITRFQSGHGWTTSTGTFGSTALNDTADYIIGTQALKVVTNTSGTNGAVDSPTYGTAIDLTGKHIRVLIKVDVLANLSNLRLFAGDASLTNYRNFNLNFSEARATAAYVKDGEWVWVTFSNRTGSVTGTGATAVTKWRLQASSTSGVAMTVHLGAIEVRAASSAFANGVMSVCFDDGRYTPFVNAKPKLDALGWAPSLYPIVDRVSAAVEGGGNYMTVADLKSWRDESGAEIGVHSNLGANHDAGFDTLTPADVEADILANRQWIYDNGLGRGEGFAWPLGAFTRDVAEAAGKLCAYGRLNVTWAPVEPWAPENRMRIRSYQNTINANVATIENLIDVAKEYKSLLALTFHEVTATGVESLSISQANFEAIMDYASTAGIEVLPLADAIRRIPSPELSVIPAGGDLSGTFDAPTVAKIKGVTISNSPTTTGQVPLSTGTGSANWAAPPTDTGFNINNRISAGEPTIPRWLPNSSSASLSASGTMLLTYFTAEVTEAITKLRLCAGGTAAGATPTLVRAGVYSVDGAGAGTLIASTTNDTSVFAAAAGSYQKTLDVTWNKTAGQRYAIGILVVTAATMPSLCGYFYTGPATNINQAPRMSGLLSGQTDLPASYTDAGLTGTSKSLAYVEALR